LISSRSMAVTRPAVLPSTRIGILFRGAMNGRIE
jgi:hypothetical protein